METLFPNIAALQKYANVNGSFDVATLEPHLKAILRTRIYPFFGKTLYNAIFAHDGEDDDVEELQAYFKEIIAKFTIAEYFKTGGVDISNNAIQRYETEHTKSAYKYQVQSNRELYTLQGWDAIESALEFIEEKAADITVFIILTDDNGFAFTDDYGQPLVTEPEEAHTGFDGYISDWVNSQYGFNNRKRFINTAEDFNAQYRIVEGRRTFHRLQPIIDDVELEYNFTFGKDFYQEIKNAIIGGTTDSHQKALLLFLKKAVAFLTIGKAIEQGQGEVTADGFIFKTVSGDDATHQSTPATGRIKKINALVEGKKWNDRLMDFLVQNINTFPTYKAHYDAQQAAKKVETDKLPKDYKPKLVRI